jgi:hypothetical protein
MKYTNEQIAAISIGGTGITSTGTTNMNEWSYPERMEVKEYSDRIEMIYKETSMLIYTSSFGSLPEERVFKIVFSCVDGKWNKSEPIYGDIVAASDESYEFEDED